AAVDYGRGRQNDQDLAPRSRGHARNTPIGLETNAGKGEILNSRPCATLAVLFIEPEVSQTLTAPIGRGWFSLRNFCGEHLSTPEMAARGRTLWMMRYSNS